MNLNYCHIVKTQQLKKAANKVTTAIDVLRKNYKEGQKWLVYCEDKTQLQTVLTAIRNEGIDAYAYYADMPGDREGTLSYFAVPISLMQQQKRLIISSKNSSDLRMNGMRAFCAELNFNISSKILKSFDSFLRGKRV